MLMKIDSPFSNKLILGSVQFGLYYGINNNSGIPNDQDLGDILDYAHTNGVFTIDSAEAYGTALERIGQYQSKSHKHFDVISKLTIVDGVSSVSSSITRMIRSLNTDSLAGVLIHDVVQYMSESSLMSVLSEVKREGLVRAIGVSVYTNRQLEHAIQDEQVDIIQVPYNLLDNQALRGTLLARAKSFGKTLHVRSVFLQGLFFKDPNALPDMLLPLKSALSKIRHISEEFDIPMNVLALGYALRNPSIDGVIVGVDSLQQLQKNIAACHSNIPQECIQEIDSIQITNNQLLNPSTWKVR